MDIKRHQRVCRGGCRQLSWSPPSGTDMRKGALSILQPHTRNLQRVHLVHPAAKPCAACCSCSGRCLTVPPVKKSSSSSSMPPYLWFEARALGRGWAGASPSPSPSASRRPGPRRRELTAWGRPQFQAEVFCSRPDRGAAGSWLPGVAHNTIPSIQHHARGVLLTTHGAWQACHPSK